MIVFGLPEPQNGSPSEKQTEDINKINELYNVMNIAKPSNYEQLFRLGRPRNDRTPQPLLSKFKPEDISIRRATLVNQWRLKELPQTDPLHDQMSKIFIHPDRTKKEQQLQKDLAQERNERKCKGEDVIIRNCKVVIRCQNS